MEFLFIILLILAAGGFSFLMAKSHKNSQSAQRKQRQEERRKQLSGEIAVMEKELKALNAACSMKNSDLKQVTDEFAIKKVELTQIQQQINDTKDMLIATQDSVNKSREYRDAEINKHREELAAQLEEINERYSKTLEQKEKIFKQALDDYETKLDEERDKYLAALSIIQQSITEEEEDLNHHIQISDNAKDDINYLLNNVANKLTNPDILYKLIWSEFIQKSTNEMLDFILPQRDCAGIYKITNDKTKKAYIGRSTSVRKRLTDHIKSAVGISTIADQKVHEAMREEGLWNFTFELIQECPKDKLSEREKFYIEYFSTEKYGYNQKAGG